MLTFDHQFTAASGAVTTGTTSLTVQEIENAGVLEILQSPGATLGHWQFLGALLDPSLSSFTFLEPLGHAREVKTAISGLFGRFVARAYATRHLHLSHYVHVRKPPMILSGQLHGILNRVPGKDGDMPDWVAWGASPGLAIVEAKGCHDTNSPKAALKRAYEQAERAEILVGAGRATFKRFAIATRWGFSGPSPTSPMLWVKDPDEKGTITDEEQEALEVAMSRWHIGNLLSSLGQKDLAAPLIELTTQDLDNKYRSAQRRASAALKAALKMHVDGEAKPDQQIVGGYVTRSGPLSSPYIEQADVEVLRKHDLRPAFVGVDVHAIIKAIEGKTPRNVAKVAHDGLPVLQPGEDGAGSWVVRLDSADTRISPQDILS